MRDDKDYAAAVRKKTREYLAVYRREHPERNRRRAYKRSAKVKHRSWALEDEDAYKLFLGECFYCTMAAGPKANGIDRVHNDEGYVIDNVVPCCFQCNDTKSDYSPAEFDSWATRFAATWPLRRERFLQITQPREKDSCSLVNEPSPLDCE